MTGELSALPPIREVISAHGLAARKALGQHFLLDLNLTSRIARAAGELSRGTTIEVGPGPGGLTRALLIAGAGRLVAIEKDERCLTALAPLVDAAEGRLSLVAADALGVDIADLGPPPRRIVANLPYNIATTLLLGWLKALADDPGLLESMTLMFQKEVAQRLAARPRSKDYGRLSVVTQWLCQVQPLFDVPAAAFTPPPRVTSSVVRLEPRAQPLASCTLTALEKITAAAFGQRRKMLRQALKSLGGEPRALLAAAGIAETARAEELSIEDFCRLAQSLEVP